MSEEKKKVPKLRFPGFYGQWEERKLGEIADFSKGQGYSKSDLLDHGTPIILYGRLYTKYQTCISEVDTFANPQNGSVYSTGNEIIVPASGETAEDIARASAVIKPGILLGADLNIIYPNCDINTVFLALAISSGWCQKELAKKAQGKSIVHLHNSDLRGVKIYYPCRAEQKKIVDILESVDKLIECQQHEMSRVKKIKKGLLQKMFPQKDKGFPDVRFPDFTDKWEQRKLSELNVFFSDGNYGESYPKPEDLTNSSNGIPFLTGRNLKDGSFDLRGASYITKKKHSELKSGHLALDDVVIAVRGTLGALGYVNQENVDWNINSQLAIIRTDKKSVIGNYLIQYMLSNKAQTELLSKATGSALKQLPIGQLKDFEIPFISLAEQREISAFFHCFDSLIALHQRKLEHFQKLKHGLLQQLFI